MAISISSKRAARVEREDMRAAEERERQADAQRELLAANEERKFRAAQGQPSVADGGD